MYDVHPAHFGWVLYVGFRCKSVVQKNMNVSCEFVRCGCPVKPRFCPENVLEDLFETLLQRIMF